MGKNEGNSVGFPGNSVNRVVHWGIVGEPLDLAYPVLFLASDESAFVTGSDFVIDGGEVWKRGGSDDALAHDARKI